MYRLGNEVFEEVDRDNKEFIDKVQDYVITDVDEDTKAMFWECIYDEEEPLCTEDGAILYVDMDLHTVVGEMIEYQDDEIKQRMLNAMDNPTWYGDKFNVYYMDDMHVAELLLWR